MNTNKSNNLQCANRILKKTLLVTSILGALSATSLQAQEAEAVEQEQEFERIFVTASKRTTGLQETPVAIQVVTGEAIKQANIADIADLQNLVPTLRVTPLERSSNVNFSLRGFGNGANNTGIEPSVGIFIDGVYRSRAGGAIGDLPRVSQIEVLSGPQSTLFGKNASAGVISVRTLEPSYDFEGKVEAGIGNYNNKLVKGYVTNGITDDLAYSLSGGFNTRDGFTESISNVEGIKDLNDKDRWNLRGQMLYEPMDDVKVRFIADYSEINEICCTVAAVINGPTTGASQALGGIVLDDADPFAFQSALNTSPTNDVEDGGVSVQVDVDFENFAFTSIVAYRTNEVMTGADEPHDVDYNSSDVLGLSTRTDIKTSTQEFRLTSTSENTLDWMVGAFFFQEQVEQSDSLSFGEDASGFIDFLIGGPGTLAFLEGAIGFPPGSFYSAGSQINTAFFQDNDAYSIFGNFDYHISDDLTATLGIAYTNDEKEVTMVQPVNEATFSSFQLPPFLAALAGVQFLPQNLDLPNLVEDNSTSDSKTTYSVRLAYTLNKNVNFFATAATGFKATSWNLSRDSRPFPSDEAALVTAGLTQPNQSYGTRYASPELATVYEVGMKTRFKKGGFNVTIFDQTIEGFQSSTFLGNGFVLANAGEQSTKGIEFDSVYHASDEWTLTLAGTFLDPVYDSFVGASAVGGGQIDLSGTKPAGIHEQSITAGIVYNYELDNGMYGYVRTDYIYESEVRLVSNVPASLTREVSTFNASAGLSFENGVMLQLYVRNLTNDEYFLSSFPPPTQTGSFSAYPNPPRTFGVNVSYEFY
ncbi:MAG: iron complex outermembrane receptor protein [Paraglaciecola sp.]|jgi:iron complex outermembrane receptor protein